MFYGFFCNWLTIHERKATLQTQNTGAGSAELITQSSLFCRTHCPSPTTTPLQCPLLLEPEASVPFPTCSHAGAGAAAASGHQLSAPASAGTVTPRGFFRGSRPPPARMQWRAWRRAALPRLRAPLTGPPPRWGRHRREAAPAGRQPRGRSARGPGHWQPASLLSPPGPSPLPPPQGAKAAASVDNWPQQRHGRACAQRRPAPARHTRPCCAGPPPRPPHASARVPHAPAAAPSRRENARGCAA